MKRFYIFTLTILAILSGWGFSAIAQTNTFSYTGAVQIYTVGTGVNTLAVDMYAAGGGIYSGATGTYGYGGRVQCVLSVTGGQLLYLYLGGKGGNGGLGSVQPGGTNSGGGADGGSGSSSNGGAAGGGSTDIRTVPATAGLPASLASRLVVAGAGAGQSFASGETGGQGGGPIGGGGFSSGTSPWSPPNGGTQTAGGIAEGSCPSCGTAGSFGAGGNAYPSFWGSGGGGGWYGGGGCYSGSGGGGSSYTDPVLVTSFTHTQGYASPSISASGNGQVVITVLCALTGSIVGSNTVCTRTTSQLTNPTGATGGVWSSDNTIIASIGSSSGLVTAGTSLGVANITYTVPNPCGGATALATKAITVLPSPAALPVTSAVCQFGTSALTSSPLGGTWTSSNTARATVDNGGNIYGVTLGTATISYTVSNGCYTTTLTTVNVGPLPVTGTPVVCASGGTSQLADISTGGTWSTGNSALATVSSSGLLTGVTFGQTIVSYTFSSTGCVASALVTVNQLPQIQTVIESGGSSYCAGSASAIHIGLGGSAAGVRYQLFNNGVSVGTSIAGTGSALDFGALSAAGTYTVVDTNAATRCFIQNPSSASITINPLPNVVSIVTPNGTSYCAGSVGAVIGINTSQNNLNYNLFLNGGAIPVTSMIGNGGAMTFPGFWSAGSYVVVASDNSSNHCSTIAAGSPLTIISNSLPAVNNVTVTNGGAYCQGGAGVHVTLDFSNTGIEYTLYRNGFFVDSVAGSNAGLDFGVQSATGNYTVLGTNAVSRCASNMNGSATVVINTPPTMAPVTGGGSYCPGHTGIIVGISASDVGALYQLYNGTTAVGAPVAGTGLGFNFGTYTAVGDYRVTGLNPLTGCKDTLPGDALIATNTPPAAFTIIGGGPFCAGGIGRDISLSGSEGGTLYRLITSGIVVDSLYGGGALDFGNYTTNGTYTIVADNGTCTTTMLGGASILSNPLPDNSHIVTGTGGYCSGAAAGAHVGLNFSDVGINYHLYSSGVDILTVPGSGSGLDFGIFPAGSYTVLGVNPATGCTSPMTGSAVVTLNLPPAATTVQGGGHYCSGTGGKDITLSSSSEGVNYQLYNGTTAVGSPVAGGSLDFGLQTAAGTYTVVATDANRCTTNMNGSATITIDPLPAVYTVMGGGGYCTNGTGLNISLSNSATGINYQLLVSGSEVGAAVAGTGSALNFGAQTVSGGYSVTATNATTQCSVNMAGAAIVTILPLPAQHHVTGGGNYCTGGAGKPVGLDVSDAGIRYQLMLGGSNIGGIAIGSGLALNFGLHTAAGNYSVMATNPATGCTAISADSVTISLDALPDPNTVAGSGAYCAGGAGLNVTLTPTEEGVEYKLYRGSVLVDSATGGIPVITFNPQTAGTYTVVGIDQTTGCAQTMTGNAVITATNVAVYSLTGGGPYCADGTGVHIGQAGSASGVSYQLMRGSSNVGAAVTGTGAALDFGLITGAGSYTVLATDLTACTATMAGTEVVTINTLPNVHLVSGNNSFCAGSSVGVPVHLDGSDLGINYQLYNGATAVGAPVAGTGIALDLASGAATGTYTVKAVNATTGCTNNQEGSAVVTVTPLPTAYAVTAENYGNYCSGDTGVHVGLINSATGVSYQLFRGGTALGSGVTGTGAALDFGLQVVAGNYTITAQDARCSNTMAGNANVYIIPLPIVHNVIGGGSYCAGGAGAHISLDGSQAGIYYQLYNSGSPVGGVVYGTGAALDFGAQPAGSYTVVGSSQVIAMSYVTTCPNPMFGSAAVSVDTPSLPSVTIRSYPGDSIGVWHIDSMKVFVTNAGTSPTFQWVINGNIIPGATAATFTNREFFNKDSIACIVTSSGPCGGLSVSKYVVLSLHNVGVTTVTAAGSDIRLVPNPNKGIFTVKGTMGTTADEEVMLEVTNMLGQVVYTNKVMTQAGVLNAPVQLSNSLANGMYVMSVRSGTQNNVIHFVIEQ